MHGSAAAGPIACPMAAAGPVCAIPFSFTFRNRAIGPSAAATVGAAMASREPGTTMSQSMTIKMTEDFWRYRVTREQVASGDTNSVLYKVHPM